MVQLKRDFKESQLRVTSKLSVAESQATLKSTIIWPREPVKGSWLYAESHLGVKSKRAVCRELAEGHLCSEGQ